ncbi:hypothetical protein GCM10011511_18370 [Puia dinghuensis]|uniref:Secretion system C-terminal sorting domain-containing protein n=2 Tax=Puia dinghuensis TaxID=1792502 RepID=A0A8J2XT21_9BACT|nr:hypothetical protein GCM10011511_18370 [Puia dinghuensis]
MKNLLLLLLSAGVCSIAHGQINAYAKVTGISGYNLTLSSTHINQTYHTFAAGEQVILIQMQDTVIGADTLNNTNFGKIGSISYAGEYFVYMISSISGSTMTLTARPSSSFNAGSKGSLQVVSYNNLGASYTVNTAIPALAWDGYIGGVVALQVSGTLTLNNNIYADGLGFRGGSVSANYEVTCEPTVYNSTSSNYAYKGEGVYGTPTINTLTNTGREPLVSGGGGGSDDNAGGGGGGNYTAGGQGGQGWTCTAATASGGFGGLSLSGYISGGRVFMGGGGGGGQQNNSVGSSGSAGGGIVFIKAGTLKTQNNCSPGSVSISAEGAAAGNSGNDGSGGAGAGGTVVLAITTFAARSSCPLTIAADGGNGGNVTDPNSHGGGGGGGQGAVIFGVSLPTTNITVTTNSGTGGTNNSAGTTSASSGSGTPGSGIMTSVPIVLPVDFLSFTAEKSGQEDVIDFSTSKTLQAVTFTVQRSADGASFSDIGVLPGVFDAGATESYVYTDVAPLAGMNYYRVKETDLSGEVRYTEIAVVDRTGDAGGFHVFPNPAHGAFTIMLTKGVTETVSYSIEDLSGATVYRGQSVATAGRIAVAASPVLTAGIYLIRVETKEGIQAGKLILH